MNSKLVIISLVSLFCLGVSSSNLTNHSDPLVNIEIISTTLSTVSDESTIVSSASTTTVTSATKLVPTTSSTASTTTNSSSVITPVSNGTSAVTTPTIPKISSTERCPDSTSPVAVHDREFDGLSFIGGFVLAVGLTAIGFIAFKFFKSGGLGMSYRTL